MHAHPDISVRRLREGVCLWFEFDGHLTLDQARDAVTRWRGELERFAGSRPCHVWHCERMSGYDPEARQLWADALEELGPRLGPVHVVTGHALVRLGAWMLAQMSGIEIHVHRHEEVLIDSLHLVA